VLRYNQGLATQLEVTDARLGLLQARTNLAQAISAFYLADAGVARAAGTPAVAPTLRPAAPTPTPPSTTPTTTPTTGRPPASAPVAAPPAR
jgi:hypothetical protein